MLLAKIRKKPCSRHFKRHRRCFENRSALFAKHGVKRASPSRGVWGSAPKNRTNCVTPMNAELAEGADGVVVSIHDVKVAVWGEGKSGGCV